jgi:nucleotide-binding universal stress UspA family protein
LAHLAKGMHVCSHMTRFRRILCASDFSKTAGRAVTAAIDLARANRARLTIVYAYVPITPLVPEQYIDSLTLSRLDLDTRRWVEREMARLVRRAKKSGIRVAATMVTGDPSAQIVRTARSTRADLIVIGTHGRRGVSKFLLGSVAERVIATAPCPVLTVRTK